MLFTLEALEAKQGDALLLHYGTPQNPQLIVIDGGPAGVYAASLSKRLAALKNSRSPGGPLPIRMVMVSHIDDDHINGILQWFGVVAGQNPRSCKISTLWHNSFDDILGNGANELTASLDRAVKAASTEATMPADLAIGRPAGLVLANVGQGRNLRLAAQNLGITINQGFGGLVMVPTGEHGKKVALGNSPADELSFTVLGPREDRVKDLQVEWDTQIKKLGVARQAEFVDDSVFNLSSIIVLARAGNKTMLLTGDSRGDDVLDGLRDANLLNNGKCHVDVLKLPHHGSDRNVSTEFFRQITADHYVCSGNGKYGNPELATLRMIIDARGTFPYTIHLTNREARLETFFATHKPPGSTFEVVYRKDTDRSLCVHLDEPLAD
jgi:hypothetical protein